MDRHRGRWLLAHRQCPIAQSWTSQCPAMPVNRGIAAGIFFYGRSGRPYGPKQKFLSGAKGHPDTKKASRDNMGDRPELRNAPSGAMLCTGLWGRVLLPGPSAMPYKLAEGNGSKGFLCGKCVDKYEVARICVPFAG